MSSSAQDRLKQVLNGNSSAVNPEPDIHKAIVPTFNPPSDPLAQQQKELAQQEADTLSNTTGPSNDALRAKEEAYGIHRSPDGHVFYDGQALTDSFNGESFEDTMARMSASKGSLGDKYYQKKFGVDAEQAKYFNNLYQDGKKQEALRDAPIDQTKLDTVIGTRGEGHGTLWKAKNALAGRLKAYDASINLGVGAIAQASTNLLDIADNAGLVGEHALAAWKWDAKKIGNLFTDEDNSAQIDKEYFNEYDKLANEYADSKQAIQDRNSNGTGSALDRAREIIGLDQKETDRHQSIWDAIDEVDNTYDNIADNLGMKYEKTKVIKDAQGDVGKAYRKLVNNLRGKEDNQELDFDGIKDFISNPMAWAEGYANLRGMIKGMLRMGVTSTAVGDGLQQAHDEISRLEAQGVPTTDEQKSTIINKAVATAVAFMPVDKMIVAGKSVNLKNVKESLGIKTATKAPKVKTPILDGTVRGTALNATKRVAGSAVSGSSKIALALGGKAVTGAIEGVEETNSILYAEQERLRSEARQNGASQSEIDAISLEDAYEAVDNNPKLKERYDESFGAGASMGVFGHLAGSKQKSRIGKILESQDLSNSQEARDALHTARQEATKQANDTFENGNSDSWNEFAEKNIKSDLISEDGSVDRKAFETQEEYDKTKKEILDNYHKYLQAKGIEKATKEFSTNQKLNQYEVGHNATQDNIINRAINKINSMSNTNKATDKHNLTNSRDYYTERALKEIKKKFPDIDLNSVYGEISRRTAEVRLDVNNENKQEDKSTQDDTNVNDKQNEEENSDSFNQNDNTNNQEQTTEEDIVDTAAEHKTKFNDKIDNSDNKSFNHEHVKETASDYFNSGNVTQEGLNDLIQHVYHKYSEAGEENPQELADKLTNAFESAQSEQNNNSKGSININDNDNINFDEIRKNLNDFKGSFYVDKKTDELEKMQDEELIGLINGKYDGGKSKNSNYVHTAKKNKAKAISVLMNRYANDSELDNSDSHLIKALKKTAESIIGSQSAEAEYLDNYFKENPDGTAYYTTTKTGKDFVKKVEKDSPIHKHIMAENKAFQDMKDSLNNINGIYKEGELESIVDNIKAESLVNITEVSEDAYRKNLKNKQSNKKKNTTENSNNGSGNSTSLLDRFNKSFEADNKGNTILPLWVKNSIDKIASNINNSSLSSEEKIYIAIKDFIAKQGKKSKLTTSTLANIENLIKNISDKKSLDRKYRNHKYIEDVTKKKTRINTNDFGLSVDEFFDNYPSDDVQKDIKDEIDDTYETSRGQEEVEKLQKKANKPKTSLEDKAKLLFRANAIKAKTEKNKNISNGMEESYNDLVNEYIDGNNNLSTEERNIASEGHVETEYQNKLKHEIYEDFINDNSKNNENLDFYDWLEDKKKSYKKNKDLYHNMALFSLMAQYGAQESGSYYKSKYKKNHSDSKYRNSYTNRHKNIITSLGKDINRSLKDLLNTSLIETKVHLLKEEVGMTKGEIETIRKENQNRIDSKFYELEKNLLKLKSNVNYKENKNNEYYQDYIRTLKSLSELENQFKKNPYYKNDHVKKEDIKNSIKTTFKDKTYDYNSYMDKNGVAETKQSLESKDTDLSNSFDKALVGGLNKNDLDENKAQDLRDRFDNKTLNAKINNLLNKLYNLPTVQSNVQIQKEADLNRKKVNVTKTKKKNSKYTKKTSNTKYTNTKTKTKTSDSYEKSKPYQLNNMEVNSEIVKSNKIIKDIDILQYAKTKEKQLNDTAKSIQDKRDEKKTDMNAKKIKTEDTLDDLFNEGKC